MQVSSLRVAGPLRLGLMQATLGLVSVHYHHHLLV